MERPLFNLAGDIQQLGTSDVALPSLPPVLKNVQMGPTALQNTPTVLDMKEDEVRPEMRGLWRAYKNNPDLDAVTALKWGRQSVPDDERLAAGKFFYTDQDIVSSENLDRFKAAYPTSAKFLESPDVINYFKNKPDKIEKMAGWRVPLAAFSNSAAMTHYSGLLSEATYKQRVEGDNSPETLGRIAELQNKVADLSVKQASIDYNKSKAGWFGQASATVGTHTAAGAASMFEGMAYGVTGRSGWSNTIEKHAPRGNPLTLGAMLMAGSADYSFVQGNEQIYQDAISRGVDPETAAEWANIGGGIMAAFDLLGTAFTVGGAKVAKATGATQLVEKMISKKLIEKAVAVKTAQTTTGVMIRGAEDLASRVLGETGTEVMQDLVAEASSDIAGYRSNAEHGTDVKPKTWRDYGQTIKETAFMMLTGGAWIGAPGTVVSVARDAKMVKQAKMAQRGLEVMQQTADANNAIKTITKDVIENPDIAKEAKGLAGHMIEDAIGEGPQTFFVEAKTVAAYFQDALANGEIDQQALERDLLEPLGVTPEQFAEALANDGPLELAYGTIPGVAENPIWQKMAAKADEVFTSVPMAEYKQLAESIEATITRALDEVFPAEDVAPARPKVDFDIVRAKAQEIAEAYRGKFSRDDAFAVATALAKNAAVRAAITGENVNELMNRVQVAPGAAPMPGALNQAMFKAEDATVLDFANRVSQQQGGQKSYFEMTADQGPLAGLSIRLPEDTLRHKDKRHPDLTEQDISSLPQALRAIRPEDLRLPKKDKPRFAGKGLLAIAEVDGQHYGLILESVNPERVIVGTYFKNTREGVHGWLDSMAQKEEAVVTPAALWPAQAPQIGGDVLHDQPDLNITQASDEDNGGPATLFQAHIPATDPRVEFRTGMMDLPDVPVVDIAAVDQKLTWKEANKLALKHKGLKIDVPDLDGSVTITRDGINDGITHDGTPEGFAVFNHLPEVIANGQWVRRDPDVSEGKKKAQETVHLYSPVKIENAPYLVKTTLKKWGDGIYEYYGHTLEKVEDAARLDSATDIETNAEGLPLSTASSSIKLIDWLENVKRKGTRLPQDVSVLYQGGQEPRGQIDVKTAQEALSRDVAAWEKEVDHFLAGRLKPTKLVTMLTQTPLIMQMLGARNLHVSAKYETLGKVMLEKHHLPPETIKQVPAAMADPIMVFKSATQGGDLVMMLDLKDQHGATVVVPIALEYTAGKGYEVNAVKSVYGQTNTETLKPRNHWFVKQISDGNLIYKNQRKSREWASSVGLQLPPGGTPSNATKTRIYNEQDLVNLKNANPDLYQGGQTAPRGQIAFMDNGQALISIFENADHSTIMHELGHYFLKNLRDLANLDPAEINDQAAWEQTKADLHTANEWVGAKPGEAWTVEQHEKFAKGFERFLYEGKAPTKELYKLFEQIKAWMVQVYRSLANLPQLNDDIRSVFNRLLASEEEIAGAGDWLDNPVFEAGEAAIAPEDYAVLNAAYEKAGEAQAQAIKRRKIGEINKMRATWRKEGGALAKQHPGVIMIDEVAKSGGIDQDSLTRFYDAAAIGQLSKRQPGLLRKGGLAFDEAAEQYGYESGDDFIQAVLEAPTQKELINDYMAQTEKEFESYIDAEEPPVDEVFDYFELVGEYFSKADNNPKHYRTPVKDLRRVIEERTGAARVENLVREDVALKARLMAEAKAAREAFAAGRKEGQMDERWKFGEKYAQDMAIEVDKRVETMAKLRAKQAARLEILKATAGYKRLVKQLAASPLATKKGGIHHTYKTQIAGILNQAGFNAGKMAARWQPAALGAFIDAEVQRGNIIYAPEWLKYNQWPKRKDGTDKTLGQLTYDEFKDFNRTVQSLVHNGRHMQTLVAGENAFSLEQTARMIAENIEKNVPKGKDKSLGPESQLLGAARDLDSATDKAEHLIRRMDGLKELGPVHEALFMPFKKAEDNKINILDAVHQTLQAARNLYSAKERTKMSTSPMREWARENSERIFVPYPKEWRTTRYTFEGAPQLLTKAEMIAVVLNMGNPDNLRNLIEGNGFTEEALAQIVGALTKTDWKFIDKQIEAINDFFPLIAEVHKKATGVDLPKVDPGTITLPNGQTRPGWYYPIASERADHVRQLDLTQELTNMGFGKKSTRAGATHERTGATLPMKLSLDVISRHINDVAHDATHRLAVRDVTMLLNHPLVKVAISERMGERTLKEFDYWVQHIAKPNVKPSQGLALDNAFEFVRRNVVRSTLMFNINSVAMQLTGLTQSADYVGFNNLQIGAKNFISAPMERAKFIREQSPSVRARDQGFDQDIQQIMKEFDQNAGTLGRGWEKFQKLGFWGIQAIDKFVVYITWEGAYQKALKEGHEHKAAVERADQAVRMTQPLASPKDTARVQRAQGMAKMFTMYYTFFSGQLNRMVERGWGVKAGHLTVGDVAKTAMWTVLMPALFGYVWADEELPDDKEGIKNLGAEMVSFQVAGVPVVRDLLNAMTSDFGYKMSPLQSAGETMTAFARDILSDEPMDKSTTKNAVRMSGILFGLPSTQILRTWQGAEDLAGGETDNPVRLLKKAPRE